MTVPAIILALIAAFGTGATIAGTLAMRRFAARAPAIPAHRPKLTILRPLCGAEPGLDEALDRLAAQDYPDFQIVLGVHGTADPAHAAAWRFAARHPGRDIVVLADPALHGINRKISNLINMLPSASHEVLVFSDSDVHAAPDYLDRIVAALQAPQVGLVTTLCIGRLPRRSLAGRLADAHMRHCFLPGALLAQWVGRQDCLGTTMALRRTLLDDVGGLRALVDHVADDNVLGRLVLATGAQIALAGTITEATIVETTLRGLWRHELRWARTIGALLPITFACSVAQFPLFWAVLAWAACPGQLPTLLLFALVFGIRLWSVATIDSCLAGRFGLARQDRAGRLVVLRDVLSVFVVGASFFGRRVIWRGHAMRAGGYPTEPVPRAV